jgi:hypothetical protein
MALYDDFGMVPLLADLDPSKLKPLGLIEVVRR